VHVHFHQKVGDADVEESDINVSIDTSDNTVYFVTSGYRPDAVPAAAHSLLPAHRLISAASRYLGVTDAKADKKADRVGYVDADGKARFAAGVSVTSPGERLWKSEVLVDSATGKILRARDRVVHGKALVADPNPVIKSGNIYGTGGLVDDDNADSDVLS